MSKIRIKNFGPIKEGFDTEDGFMDIKKVTVFIGDQGTGKSTVAKLISMLTWMEKAINRGDIEIGGISFATIFEIAKYQGIRSYFLMHTEIHYIGRLYSIKFDQVNDMWPLITIVERPKYIVPQVVYVSAERNFLTTIASAYDVKNLPGHLVDFAQELKRAQRELDGAKIDLPIRGYSYQYLETIDQSFIYGNDYQVNLLEASSGLQSLVPLYIVSQNLSSCIGEKKDELRESLSISQSIRRNEEIAKLMLDKSLSDDEKKVRLEQISSKYRNACFINIVEEPEQNLFPNSQRVILNSLLEFNNMTKGNKLIMTTHSPYIISYLGIAVQGHNLLEKINAAGNPDGFKERMENEVIPSKSVIAPGDLVIYQLQENGTISRLPDYEGIPADKNYLNQSLVESNQLFDKLLEIEEDL